MGLFSSILDKLGFGHTAPVTLNTSSAAATPAASPQSPRRPLRRLWLSRLSMWSRGSTR